MEIICITFVQTEFVLVSHSVWLVFAMSLSVFLDYATICYWILLLDLLLEFKDILISVLVLTCLSFFLWSWVLMKLFIFIHSSRHCPFQTKGVCLWLLQCMIYNQTRNYIPFLFIAIKANIQWHSYFAIKKLQLRVFLRKYKYFSNHDTFIVFLG